jgi:hypothetical protein
MLFSWVPITAGVAFFFFKTMVVDPAALLSVRNLTFFLVAFGLLAAFFVIGVHGLWRRKRYGYWFCLLFLAVLSVKNVYSFVPTVERIIAVGSNESGYLSLGYRSEELMILDVAVQSILLVCILLLLLKVMFGKAERKFFDAY